MKLFNWLSRKKDNESLEINRFVELIKKNNELENEINDLCRSFLLCCDELYKHTGNIEHSHPQYWFDKLRNENNIHRELKIENGKVTELK